MHRITPVGVDLLPRERPPRDRLLLPGRLGRERRAVQHLEPASNFTAHAHVQVRLGGLDVVVQVVADCLLRAGRPRLPR